MLGFLARRTAGLLVSLLLVSLVVFAALDLLPGDPAAVMLGTSAQPETLAALRAELGLDRPAPERFLGWLGGIAVGDLGISTTYGVPVATLVLDRLAVTIPLAALSIGLALALALPLAVAAAERRGGWVDRAATLYAQGGVAVPNFWLGLLLIILFAATWRIAPAGGFPGWNAGIGQALAALVLPAVALGLPQGAILTRVARGAILDLTNEDFVRTARAKGLSKRRALWRHVLPNAAIPVVTILGLQFSYFLGGAILVENVFALPGLGQLAYQAMTQRDLPTLQAVALILAAFVILVNLLVDLSYAALDPRIAR